MLKCVLIGRWEGSRAPGLRKLHSNVSLVLFTLFPQSDSATWRNTFLLRININKCLDSVNMLKNFELDQLVLEKQAKTTTMTNRKKPCKIIDWLYQQRNSFLGTNMFSVYRKAIDIAQIQGPILSMKTTQHSTNAQKINLELRILILSMFIKWNWSFTFLWCLAYEFFWNNRFDYHKLDAWASKRFPWYLNKQS